jgi:hypothetical protein
VQVCVDQAGRDVGAVRVHDLVAVVAAEPSDHAVADGDVALEPLAGEDREHAPPADDEIRRLVAARDREPARKITRQRHSQSSRSVSISQV